MNISKSTTHHNDSLARSVPMPHPDTGLFSLPTAQNLSTGTFSNRLANRAGRVAPSTSLVGSYSGNFIEAAPNLKGAFGVIFTHDDHPAFLNTYVFYQSINSVLLSLHRQGETISHLPEIVLNKYDDHSFYGQWLSGNVMVGISTGQDSYDSGYFIILKNLKGKQTFEGRINFKDESSIKDSVTLILQKFLSHI